MSSGFISEKELAEKRRIRQEEWEKVRQASQPLDVPEEPYDHRSLYERLEEQKKKKQMEYEEAHRLRNMIKGLDDDEVEFLDLVDQRKLEAEQLKELEERQELLDFKMKVKKLREQTLDQKRLAEIQPTKSSSINNSGIKSQHQLLKGVVVKKKLPVEAENMREEDSKYEQYRNECCRRKRKRIEDDANNCTQKIEFPGSGLTCVGILPGLGSYVESSDDSDRSSSCSEGNVDDKKYDLTGRRIVYKSKHDPE